jgi:fatty-acyl-CoA synthase
VLIDLLLAHPSTAPALVCGERRLSFGELVAQSRRLAKGLAGLGVKPGERIALWLPNDPAWLMTLLACAELGATVISVNTRFRSAEIADIVSRSRARTLIYAPKLGGVDYAAILEQVERGALDGLRERVVVGARAAGAIDFDALLANDGRVEQAGNPAQSPDTGCLVWTTSGTTRAPKFVLHSQRSLATHARDVAAGFGWSASATRLLQTLPYAGAFGMTQALAALAAGAPSHVPTAFEVESAARLIAEQRITDFNASDEMIRRLIECGTDFASVRGVGYAAFDPGLGDIVELAASRGLALFGLYGASEVQALYARQPLAAPLALRRRNGGRPVSAQARFRVRDPESGELLGPGVSGALEVAGPSRMLGYLDNEEANREALTPDGFVRMGDLAHEDGDGGFVYEARVGDVLRLGGYLVAPAEIEARLQAHPAVGAAQVVGVRSEKGGVRAAGGPVAVAFVTLRDGSGIAAFDERALMEWCAAALARYKVPAAIIRLDAFPVTQSANGTKIQKAKLRELADAALAGRSPGN